MGDLDGMWPLDEDMWVVQLTLECASQSEVSGQDLLLVEMAKIFDDLVQLSLLDNKIFTPV